MNEQLKEASEQLLLNMISTLESTGEWIAGEIPLVIGELLKWTIVSEFIDFLFGVLLIGVICYFVYLMLVRKYKWQVKMWKETDGIHLIPVCLAWIIVALVSSIFINITWLKAWIAPRVFLLEYAASLVK